MQKAKNSPADLIPKPILMVGLPLITLSFLIVGFLILRDEIITSQFLNAVFAIIWGVGGITLLYFVGNWVVEQLSEKWMTLLQPYVFVGPALFLLGWYLVLPTIRSFISSLYNTQGEFIGLGNYQRVFTEQIMVQAWSNNIVWIVVGTSMVVILGLLIAILADRSSFERVAKSLIFMPMAISMVGAGVIWKFMYDYNQETNIGLLNALITGGGGQPVQFLTDPPMNTIYLIIVMVWLQTGYTMVLISAAIKGIPDDLLEAARVDGASEVRIFRSIILPNIAGTILTCVTTVVIFTLKIFDIVRVMTGGNFGTDVIGVQFYKTRFSQGDAGLASAIAIVLLLAVVPVMIYNLREFSKRESF
jgi:alpha-glucoside transport system permease protein